jgi:hypothetical protein
MSDEQTPQEKPESLIKKPAQYAEVCCYGCFKMGPRESMPGWLCADCVAKRAAAKLEKDAEKAE